ncbi:YqaJ viral recombinase family protein [Limnobacter sp.]|uniref:YqaJ viral recombinase family protein n=1 Tax=Limnobacter sp. TaxID=2003368 RepID=UPI002734DA32|nr:YqaJ viral recombinase family protein [Limnobacter sp.]MDP3273414.1 YqaJ viral recombinase family protein [Limnobacter sp.]
MITHNLKQGSAEWHAYRAQHFNASDAPAMLGVSAYKSRTELLNERAAGLTAEVDAGAQYIFDKGHEFEALARPLAEKIIGEDLYPVTGSEGKYSASFDGLTILNDVAFEHKTLNDQIRAALSVPGATANDLPMQYQVQMEQQCMVSGCEKVLFMASKWAGNELAEEMHAWYTPNPELRQRIINGWEQFEADLEGHTPVIEVVKAQGTAPESLPALRIELVGQVANTNLPVFKEVALAVLNEINTTLVTDEDFASAEKTVKWCSDVESRLASAKQHALSQTATIEELFRTVDEISEMTRQKRLTLEKLVKTQKEAIRLGIVKAAAEQWALFHSQVNDDLGISAELVSPDFNAAVKGKRTVSSIQDAVDTALANAKAAGNEKALLIGKNLKQFEELTQGHAALFFDKAQLVQKPVDVMTALIEQRITKAKAEEAERERIKAEREAEQAKRAEAQMAQAEARKLPPVEMRPSEVTQTVPNTTKALTKTRPTDAEIVDALCLHFRVHQSKVVEWLCEMDLSDESLLEQI